MDLADERVEWSVVASRKLAFEPAEDDVDDATLIGLDDAKH